MVLCSSGLDVCSHKLLLLLLRVRWWTWLLHNHSTDAEPLLLDVGQFWVPGLCQALGSLLTASAAQGLVATRATRQSAEIRWSSSSSGSPAPAHGASLQEVPNSANAAAVAAAVVAIKRGGSPGATACHLQLYTLIPHRLRARCKLWEGKLNLKQGAQQISKGYFAAPGES